MFTLIDAIPYLPHNARNIAEELGANAYLKDILSTYSEDFWVLTAYDVAVTKAQLCVFNKEPKWFDIAFRKRFILAKTNAEVWINSIGYRLLAVPQTIVNYNGLYKMQRRIIKSAAEMLIKNPSPEDKKELINTLVEAINELEKFIVGTPGERGIVPEVEAIKEELDTYCTNITSDAAFFKNTFNKVAASQQEQAKAIEDTTKAIKDLEARIQFLSEKMRAEAIAAGVTGGVAILFHFIFPLFSPAFTVMCAAASIGTAIAAIVNDAEVKIMVAALGVEKQTLKRQEQDLLNLKTLSTTFTTLNEKAQKAQKSLGSIIDVWKALAEKLGKIKEDLSRDGMNVKKEHFQAILDSMQSSDDNWDQLVEFAEKMVICASIKIDDKLYPLAA